jgi:hypothetical protein
MLRGGTVVFAALVSKIVLDKRFSWRHLIGLGGVVFGLFLCGLAGQLKSHGSGSVTPPGQVLLGIILIVCSSGLQGTQSVLEEKYMKKSDKFTVAPLELVGWEGVFGSLISGLIVLPIAHSIPGKDCGKVENTHDTLLIIANNHKVLAIMIVYTLNIAVFNFLSTTVSNLLSAVHRQLINASRTVTIWAVQLFLYYQVKRSLGEDWTNWSFLQLCGFVCLLSGSLTYGLAPPVPVPPKVEDEPMGVP